MDIKTFKKTLRMILVTLQKVEVRGSENLGMVLGMIGLIEKSLAAIEEDESNGE